MKQTTTKTSIQPKVLRSAIVTITAFAMIALVPIAVLSQSTTTWKLASLSFTRLLTQ